MHACVVLSGSWSTAELVALPTFAPPRPVTHATATAAWRVGVGARSPARRATAWCVAAGMLLAQLQARRVASNGWSSIGAERAGGTARGFGDKTRAVRRPVPWSCGLTRRVIELGTSP